MNGIYNADLIKSATTVIITSDVPSADALKKIGMCGITWKEAHPYTCDWSGLYDKKIVFWPTKKTENINELKDLAAYFLVEKKADRDSIRFYRPGKILPENWNAKKAIEDGEEIKEHIKKYLITLDHINDEDKNEDVFQEKRITREDFQNRFFKILGYDRDEYFYLSNLKRQIVCLKASAHTVNNFLQLAPLTFWEQYTVGDGKLSINAIADHLISECHRVGVFNASKVRGVGAWWEKDHAVIHMGDQLKINDETLKIEDYHGDYIYELSSNTSAYKTGNTSGVEHTKEILKIFDLLPISSRDGGVLLAGWCVIAPLCGILRWRPHIWLTGAAGVGKSYTKDNIIEPIIGDIALDVVAGTTEAGIRQMLGNDARPIIHDETEAEDHRAMMELQSKIMLARAASSDSNASVIKGTSGHKAVSFKIRSCFLFSSINVNLKMQSDQGRFTVFEFNDKKKINEENFIKLKKLIGENLSRKQCQEFRSRSIAMIPTIKTNIEVFESAGVKLFGSQRTADQYAPMLAGYVSMIKDDIISEAEATKIIKDLQIGLSVDKDERNDGEKCLDAILQAETRIDFEDHRKQRILTIGELIDITMDGSKENCDKLSCSEAHLFLRRCGIKAEGDYLYISNDHKKLKDFLKETPWAQKWRPVLKRLSDDSIAPVLTWPDKTRGRATKIPMSIITGEENNSGGIPF